MSKPVSASREVGRAVGYKVDVDLLLEKLKDAPLGDWDALKTNRAFLAQIERAAQGEAAESKPKRLWVVVKAEHGVPVMLDAYRDKHSANRREKFLRQHMRPEIDEVAKFDIKL
ncbi:MAG: hypothetical protein HY782_10440 [Chloroflexi bacterium]|nr:hypothetical protein [Chloroflexota bacterium]